MDPSDSMSTGESLAPRAAELPDHTSSSDAYLTTASLEALRNTEQRKLMDVVDRLRQNGLSSGLQLPRVVVCGDQSSGKSSVLEAITEIPFPCKANLCTRFATEIIMRRNAETAISCKINPDSGRTDDEKVELRKFSRVISEFTELPCLVGDATTAMGLGEKKAFGKDVLSIEICGPQGPQLTLVDLPGLIHSPTGSQFDEDVKLIKSLVECYMAEESTIILAVVSAKNDYANTVVLDACRKFDPKGSRTLGVITKPDYLPPGGLNERQWLELANNRDIALELGWHILKNRDDRKGRLTLTERNADELQFFSTGSYQKLSQGIKGIDSLRERLSQLLLSHLKRELPALNEELDNMARSVQAELQSLGRIRATIPEQRACLAEILTAAYEIAVMGVNGNYDRAFFGGVSLESSIDGEKNTRLRTVVQQLNVQFTSNMHERGHKYYIHETDTGGRSSTGQAERSQFESSSAQDLLPLQLSRDQAIIRAIETLRQTRGREIPGTFNAMLISHLFRDQSEGWKAAAEEHINRVAVACRHFLQPILDHVAPPELRSRLRRVTVQPALKRFLEMASNELNNIMEDAQRHPITYNKYFTDMLRNANLSRVSSKVSEVAQNATAVINEWHSGGRCGARQIIRPEIFHETIGQALVEGDLDRSSAEQALDAHDAYYRVERRYFIDVVTKQVIERHLIAPLADTFSPKTWAAYSDEEVQFLASERPETVKKRKQLEEKKKVLEEGQQAFGAALGQSD